MSTLNIPVLVTVLLRVPMFCFGFASLTFFLRQFDDPIVTWVLKGLFSTYFLAVGVGCGRGTVATAARRRHRRQRSATRRGDRLHPGRLLRGPDLIEADRT